MHPEGEVYAPRASNVAAFRLVGFDDLVLVGLLARAAHDEEVSRAEGKGDGLGPCLRGPRYQPEAPRLTKTEREDWAASYQTPLVISMGADVVALRRVVEVEEGPHAALRLSLRLVRAQRWAGRAGRCLEARSELPGEV